MPGIIKTDAQASIRTTVVDSNGVHRPAILSSKQFILTKLLDLGWHNRSEFTSKISSSGLRGRLSELRSVGYNFETRYTPTGRIGSVRLVAFPGVGTFRASA